MKTISFIPIFACAALMIGTSYAVPSNPTYEQSSAESPSRVVDDGKHAQHEEASDEQPSHRHPSGNKHLRSSATATAGKHAEQVPKQEAFRNSSTMNVRPAALGESGRAAREGLVHNEILNNSALPTRPPSVVPRTGRSANDLRHRGPNPAVIDGAMNSNVRNTGSINGTRMNRRP